MCRFIEEEVIDPVDHRQLVFVLPKMLRQNFHRDPEMLTGLCRAAADATQSFDFIAWLSQHIPHARRHQVRTYGALSS